MLDRAVHRGGGIMCTYPGVCNRKEMLFLLENKNRNKSKTKQIKQKKTNNNNKGKRENILARKRKFGPWHNFLGKWSQNLAPIHKTMLPEIATTLSEQQECVLFAGRGSQVEQNRKA